MLTMKDLKASLEKFNKVTDDIKSLINSNKNKQNINNSKIDNILVEENQSLKNKNASTINKLEKILFKINNILENK